ncbi:molybdate ABC transporter substrate-binding protein [Vibrio sinensis]|uniref:Molybdate ABC transporter substrate-binding protein n=1 Tax=Vibrio sinensis TaxID=2302434 RepID=A0A3A6QSX3_9VIBR|nr:molybdate ABC transporter substrate-binding protein [Vibrio sinensis]RJX75473.1 molybdate ABC transporter substrate-binding protein [Vibrio sinensis]
MNKFLLLLLSTLAFLSSTANAGDNVRVYAASSLTNVMNELINHYQQATNDKVMAVYAGSSSLARQIENGAPADVYISANVRWVQYLKDKQIIDAQQVTPWLYNELVLIAPTDGSESFDVSDKQAWLSALGDRRLAVAQPNAVPAGIYAQQSLENLQVWPALMMRLAPTSNVRVALTLVERNEAALGIVYKTDAQLSDKVKSIYQFSSQSHDPIMYPIASLNSKPSVQSFVQFLQSDDAKNIVQKYGFIQP